MPPSLLIKIPTGQKNHSFFIRKRLLTPVALLYSTPMMKSQLLVCGARAMMHLRGSSTPMSTRNPAQSNSILWQIDCRMLTAI